MSISKISSSPDSGFWTKLNTIRQSYSTEQAQAPDNLPLSLWVRSSGSKQPLKDLASLQSACNSGCRRTNALKAFLKDEAKTKFLTLLVQLLPDQPFHEIPFPLDTLPVLEQYAPRFLIAAVLPAAAAPNQSALPAHRLIEPPRFLKPFQNWKLA